jgi:diadenosine tetraphosphate (Ap4A) HIT family hydrolase
MVPRRPDIQEIIDLPAEDRSVLMEEICLVSEQMRMSFNPDKINVAALGNMVPQLHIHVVARYRDDPVWPNPVWGTPSVPYDEMIRKSVMDKLGRFPGRIDG